MTNHFTRKSNLPALSALPILSTYLSIAMTLVQGEGARNPSAEVFSGPGIVECAWGTCEFSVRDGSGLGCSDPCHTRKSRHAYDSAFAEIARTSGGFRLDGNSNDGIGGELCFHEKAEDIVAYWPDRYVDIEEGCVAECTGCTFTPTEIISGPGKLECQEGRCTHYTTKAFDCGNAIHEASEASGSMHTLLHGSNVSHRLHGFENINTGDTPIDIPNGCTLECSGCSFTEVRNRQRNLRTRESQDEDYSESD